MSRYAVVGVVVFLVSFLLLISTTAATLTTSNQWVMTKNSGYWAANFTTNYTYSGSNVTFCAWANQPIPYKDVLGMAFILNKNDLNVARKSVSDLQLATTGGGANTKIISACFSMNRNGALADMIHFGNDSTEFMLANQTTYDAGWFTCNFSIWRPDPVNNVTIWWDGEHGKMGAWDAANNGIESYQYQVACTKPLVSAGDFEYEVSRPSGAVTSEAHRISFAQDCAENQSYPGGEVEPGCQFTYSPDRMSMNLTMLSDAYIDPEFFRSTNINITGYSDCASFQSNATAQGYGAACVSPWSGTNCTSINATINVTQRGNLTLENCEIRFNVSTNVSRVITGQIGSNITLIRANITTNESYRMANIQIVNNANFTSRDSVFSWLGTFGSNSAGSRGIETLSPPDQWQNNSLWMTNQLYIGNTYGKSFISNTTILNSYSGINLVASNTTIDGLYMLNTGAGRAFTCTGQNFTLRNVDIQRVGTNAIFHSSGCNYANWTNITTNLSTGWTMNTINSSFQNITILNVWGSSTSALSFTTGRGSKYASFYIYNTTSQTLTFPAFGLFANVNDSVFENITSELAFSGLSGSNLKNVTFNGVTVNISKGYGFYMDRALNITIRNCRILNTSGGYGALMLGLNNQQSNISVENCEIVNSTTGLNISQSIPLLKDISIKGCSGLDAAFYRPADACLQNGTSAPTCESGLGQTACNAFGCGWYYCLGATPLSCGLLTQTQCSDTVPAGKCAWSGCTGTLVSGCAGISESGACVAVSGCSWAGTCTGTPVGNCYSINNQTQCGFASGCTWQGCVNSAGGISSCKDLGSTACSSYGGGCTAYVSGVCNGTASSGCANLAGSTNLTVCTGAQTSQRCYQGFNTSAWQVFALNVSYTSEQVGSYGFGGNFTLFRQWYLDTYSNISSANVTVRNSSGVIMNYSLVNSTGWGPRLNITQYINYSASMSWAGNYTIQFNKSGEINFTIPWAIGNGTSGQNTTVIPTWGDFANSSFIAWTNFSSSAPPTPATWKIGITNLGRTVLVKDMGTFYFVIEDDDG